MSNSTAYNVIFSTSLQTANETAEQYQSLGYSAKVVASDNHNASRGRIFTIIIEKK